MWIFQFSMPNGFGSRAFQRFRRPFLFFTLFIWILHLCLKNNWGSFWSKNFNLHTFLPSGMFAHKRLLSGKLSTFLPLHGAIIASRKLQNTPSAHDNTLVTVVLQLLIWSNKACRKPQNTPSAHGHTSVTVILQLLIWSNHCWQ